MIYPMFAMVLLVGAVAAVMFRSRVRAVRERKLSIKYFRAMSGGEVPDYAAVPSRHFANLFEVPILFYAVCVSAMVLQATGPLMMTLAWMFVAARYSQAWIHLTYNNVIHRMVAFAVGLLVVLLMWIVLVISAT